MGDQSVFEFDLWVKLKSARMGLPIETGDIIVKIEYAGVGLACDELIYSCQNKVG